ncbi:energy transducer TonB [Chitinophaga sp. GCM10012297]|uniref:TonB family protein n=1 Tax=Chitinophaga chungangae TaxID=2821488 RepID=A0ABS3Y884_9BACT|nr:energy transducer TonB [Chitinophaga chungangae]MBO9150875.1 TonB family protein [Chitinophaga chungangae]
MQITLAAIFLFFSLSALAQQQDSIPREPDPGFYENIQADQLPQFPGGPDKLRLYIASHLVVPYILLENDTIVTVIVDFVVEHTGEISNARIRTPGFRQLDREVINLFSNMPPWQPGYLNRKPVSLNVSMPINVDLGNTKRKPYDVPTPELGNLPQYRGGGQALAYFIRKNMRYPAEARKAGIGGAVIVEFLVMSNGTVGNAGTLGDVIGYGLEEEAVRIVEKMPRWIPAKLDGKPVTAKHKVIVRFEPPRSTAQKTKTD